MPEQPDRVPQMHDHGAEQHANLLVSLDLAGGQGRAIRQTLKVA